MDCGLKINEQCESCVSSPTPPVLLRPPNRPVAMPAFNPSATITRVSPTQFKPGDNIDIDVEVHANNPDMWWNTVIVVTRGDNGEVYCKTHGMIAAEDDFVEPIVCGKMPSGGIQLTVEIWGHDDYYSSPPTICA